MSCCSGASVEHSVSDLPIIEAATVSLVTSVPATSTDISSLLSFLFTDISFILSFINHCFPLVNTTAIMTTRPVHLIEETFKRSSVSFKFFLRLIIWWQGNQLPEG